ncbi:MAG: FUSC family protein [Acidimicrobiia bacterium]
MKSHPVHLVHDAKSLAVRRGLRAAIALPGLLAIIDWLSDGDFLLALFAAFAAFALLALADFGGPPRARATAYLVATAIGSALIVIGTLVSPTPWLAALVTLIVGFVVMEVASFGGTWSVGMFGTMLAYILAATLEASASDIPTRVAGWAIGGVVATVMALVLWPVYERPALWNLAADALRAAAALVRARGKGDARDAAEQAVRALRTAYAKAPYRPAGPAVRDRAFIALMEGLERLVELEPGPVEGPPDVGSDDLRTATSEVLDATAAYITAPATSLPDLKVLDAARSDHRTALGERVGASLRDGAAADEVLTDLEGAWWTRVVSFMAISLAADAVIGIGGAPPGDAEATAFETPVQDAGDRRARVKRVLKVNVDVGSIRFRNAVRTAVGLALAVLIAGLLSLDHAFWVGLATLSVLRSNALATGRTAIEAVGGTVVGFLVVFVFFGIFDADVTAEWIALPIAAFLATYAPSAISFVVGQAAFTVTIVLLFDVIEPEGWQTGVVRVEDIALGAVVSLVVGLLLWPRGAVGLLRRVLGAQLRADARYLDAAMQGIVSGESETRDACCADAVDAERRVADAYDDLLAAPGTLPPDHEMWGAIAAAAHRVQAATDLLVVQAQLGFVIASFPDAVTALRAETSQLAATLGAEADALQAGRAGAPVPNEPRESRRAAEVETLARWGGRDDADVSAAIGVVWAGEVLHATDLAVRRAAESVTQVAAPPG